MAIDKNILMKQFNGTDYDILYPITNDAQVKLNQTIAENFFGAGTSKTSVGDALEVLSKNYLYCWKKRSNVLEITEDSYPELYLYTGSSSGSVSAIQYASGYTYDEPTNTWALKDVVGTINVSASNYTSLNAAAGYYVKCNAVKVDTALHTATENPFVAKVTTATGSATSAATPGSNYFITFSGVRASAKRVLGDWEYVYSSNFKAYPKNQIVNDVEYVYLGVPNDNALEGKKIFIGQYKGTGKKKFVLYFPFTPDIYGVIYCDFSKTGGQVISSENLSKVSFVPWGVTPVQTNKGGSKATIWNCIYGGLKNTIEITQGDYDVDTNLTGNTYYYWGIGTNRSVKG